MDVSIPIQEEKIIELLHIFTHSFFKVKLSSTKIFFAWILLCLIVNKSFSQQNTFFRKYNLPGMQGALQLEITDDGGFIATGQHEGNGSHGDCDIYVYKLDICGNIEWFKLYGTGGQEGGKSIIKLADSSYLVSGLYSGSGSFRGFNMKIDSVGNLVWIKRYGFEWMMYTKEAANGDLICLGRNSGSMFLLRTTSTGNIIWSKQIFGFGDMGLWLDELPNGDIIMTSVNNSISKDFTAGRFTATGTPIWMKAYGSTTWADVDHSTWTSKGLVDTVSNCVIITSLTTSGGLSDHNILVAKIGLDNGNVTWSKVFGGNGRDQSRDIAKYPGGYAILGHSSSFPTPANAANNIYEALGEKDILLFSLDTNGQLNWARTYGGSDRDKGVGVKFNGDNGFSISGITTSPYFGNNDNSFDPLFVKTDSIGFVGCQTHTPPINVIPITLTSGTAGSVNTVTVNSDVPNISVNNYLPSDQYICQTCQSIPEFTISDTTVCVNQPVYFTNTTLIGLTCFQQWNVNGLNIDGQIDPVVTFPTAGVHTIYLYSSCGVNSDTIIKTITVIDPQINAPDFLCSDAQPVQLSGNNSTGIWSGNGVSSNGQFNPNGLSTGYQYINFTVPAYCSITDSIEIRPLPFVNAGPDTSLCFSETLMLQGNVAPNNSVLWTPSSNLSASTIPNPILNFTNTSTSNQIVNLNYQVTNTLTTCSNSDNVAITFLAKPPLNAGNDDLLCLGESYIANATGPGALTWLPSTPNGSVYNLPLGIHELVVWQVDQNDCEFYDTVQITVVNNPSAFAGPDTLICIGQDVQLNATSPNQVTYSWNVNLPNGSAYTPNSTGDQNLIVQVTDNNNCQGQDTLLLQVQSLPTADFTYQTDCYSTVVSITNQSSINTTYNDQLLYEWWYNGNIISTSSSTYSYDFLSSGNVSVSLVCTSQQGLCTDSLTQIIVVPTNPVIDFTYQQECDYIANFQGVIPSNEQIVSNIWSYSSDQFGLGNLTPSYDFPNAGSYLIDFTFTNDYPCTYSVQKLITLIQEESLEEQIIPNVLTPNNDGINDFIDFSNEINECLEFKIIMVNRWGNVVYEASETGPVFNGTDQAGKALLEGTYYYKITSDNSVRHGFISIVK
jgi:gliding motility-associated-like protein